MTDPTAQIPGPKVLLMGDSGTGKTHAIRTLIDAGVTPFVIATEQNCIQTLKDIPAGKWHYKFINAQPENNWGNLQDMLSKVNKLSYENLTKVQDPNKSSYNQLLDVLTTCNKFVCDCHKEDFGDVSLWDNSRALVIDGLSGLSDMAMGLTVGNKPVRSMPDWGVSQNSLKSIIAQLTTAVRCPFILIAHIDREKDEITGGTSVTVKTLGQKLGPDLPRMFSDVIRAKREGNKFSWDTADSQATVVSRNIPIASNQAPSFVPLFTNWRKGAGVSA